MRNKRPSRKPAKRGIRSRITQPSSVRREDDIVNLLSIAAVGGQATKKDLAFSRPVFAQLVGSPPSTDFQLVCGGETTRTLVGWAQQAPNVLRAEMSGALTGSKTYVGTLAALCGSVVPQPNNWGNKTANIVT